jgi:hypothetical protein
VRKFLNIDTEHNIKTQQSQNVEAKNLFPSSEKHGKSKEHISSKFQLLDKLNVTPAIHDARKIHIESHNLSVKHSRDIIKR